MQHKAARLVGATLAAGALAASGVLTALPASALGTTSWNDCWEGYAGSSWYTSSTGVGHASTTEGDAGCTGANLGVAIRYNQGNTAYTWSDQKYIIQDRAAALSGGYHRSNKGSGLNPT